MNRHWSRIQLPLNSRLAGTEKRDWRYDRAWHLYCETCRSLAKDGLEVQVELKLPSDGRGDADVTITAQGTITSRKTSAHHGRFLPPKLTLEQIKQKAAADRDEDAEYWAEMARLASGAQKVEDAA